MGRGGDTLTSFSLMKPDSCLLLLCDLPGRRRAALPSCVLLTLIIESQSSDPFQSVRNTGDFVSIPASWQTTPISAAITGWVSRPSAQKKRGPITLLWDEIPIHRAQAVQRFLHKHRRIVVEEFPPYAPELNPVDYVWSYVKHSRLANYCPPNPDALRDQITTEFRRLQKRPDLLRSFFDHTGLSLTPLKFRKSETAPDGLKIRVLAVSQKMSRLRRWILPRSFDCLNFHPCLICG